MISAKSYKGAKAILFSTTDHCDLAHPNNDIKTMTHSDGLGRIIQIRKDIDENGTERRSVSGKIKYDGLGRKIEEYQPISIGIGHF